MLRDGGAFYCYNGPEVMALTDAAENIRRLRARAGLTQDALAEKLCVARQTVSSWETGRTEPDIGALEGLAAALGCTAQELICGDAPAPSGRDTKRFRRRAVIFGCVTAALLIAALFLHPRLKAQSVESFEIWPMIVYFFALRLPRPVFGTLCVMSALSAITDISITNGRLRMAFLVLGTALSVFCLYAISPMMMLSLPYPAGRFWLTAYTLEKYTVLFAIPVCLIYLGAIKPPRNGTAAK